MPSQVAFNQSQLNEGPIEFTIKGADSVGTQADRNQVASIVAGISAYNEEVAIGSLVIQLKQNVDHVVVVDDGSQDATARIAEKAGAIVIEHSENRGKGAAIQTMLKYAKRLSFDAFLLLDGDGQHNPGEINKVARPILEDEYDLVVGSRYLTSICEETPRHRRIGQLVLDLLTTTDSKFTDTQSGFRALSPKAVESLDLSAQGYAVESEMIQEAVDAGLQITEMPISVRYRGIDGQSSGPLTHGLSIIYFLLKRAL